MNAALVEIVAAVTEAQAVVELVAQRLGGAPLVDDQQFTLHAALNVALQRLDAVHESVFISAQEDVTAAACGVMQ